MQKLDKIWDKFERYFEYLLMAWKAGTTLQREGSMNEKEVEQGNGRVNKSGSYLSGVNDLLSLVEYLLENSDSGHYLAAIQKPLKS